MANFDEIARRYGGSPSGGKASSTETPADSPFHEIAKQFGGRLVSGGPDEGQPQAAQAAPLPAPLTPPEEPDTDILDRLSAGTRFETPGGKAFREYSDALQRYEAQRVMADAAKDEGFFDRLGSMFGRADIAMQGAGRDISAGLEQKFGRPERAQQILAQSEALRREAGRGVAGEISPEDVSENWWNAPEYLAQQAAGSAPSMLLAASGVGAPAAAAILGGQIARDRATADNRTGFLEGEDLAVGTAVGVASTALDMVGLGGILGGASKTVLGRIGKAFATEGATEALQSGLEYTGGSLGTERGFDAGELGRQMLVGGLTGAGIGAGVRGTGELVTAPFRTSEGQKLAQEENKRLEIEGALARASMTPSEKARQDVVDRFERLYGFSREDAELYTNATLQTMGQVSEATGTPIEKAPSFVSEFEEEAPAVAEPVAEEEAITISPEEFGFTMPPTVEEETPSVAEAAPIEPTAPVEQVALTPESYVDRYVAGEGRGATPADLELQQFAANYPEEIEAEFAKRTAPVEVVPETPEVLKPTPPTPTPVVEEAVAPEVPVTTLPTGEAQGAYEKPSTPVLSRDAVAPADVAGDITQEQREQIDLVAAIDGARSNLLIDNLERNSLLEMLAPPPDYVDNPSAYPQWQAAIAAQQRATVEQERLAPQIAEAEAEYEAAKEVEKRKYGAKSAKGIPESSDMRLARIKRRGLEEQLQAAQNVSLDAYRGILGNVKKELDNSVRLRKARTADIEYKFKTGKIDARERAIALRENKVQRFAASYRLSGPQTDLAKAQLELATKTKSATAILKLVARSDSPLAATAERLLKISPNVPVRVVSPEVMASLFRSEGARMPEAPQGLWVPERNAIYLSSDMQTDHVPMHEIVHAVIQKHITDKTAFGKQLTDIFDMYEKLASPDQKLEYGFKDAHEFVSEVWGNPDFRTVLETIIPPARKTETSPQSLLDRIVEAVKKFFGKTKEDAPVRDYIEEVMSITEAAAAQPAPAGVETETAAAPAAAPQTPPTPDEIRKVVEADERVSRGMAKAQIANSATRFAQGIDEAVKGKSLEGAKEDIKSRWNALKSTSRAPLLTALSADYILAINEMNSDVAQTNERLREVIKLTENINGMRGKLRDRFQKLSAKYTKYANKNGTQGIGLMLATARVNNIDPFEFATMQDALVNDSEVKGLEQVINNPQASAQDVRSAKGKLTLRRRELRDVYQLREKVQATKGGEATAKSLVQFYSDMFTAMRLGLNTDIKAQGLDPDSEAKLLTAIEEMQAKAGKGPYSPFMRFGKYWLTVEGKAAGTGRERFHFESAIDRDKFRMKRAKELGVNPDDGMIFKTANSLEEFTTGLEQDSFLLSQINKTISGLDMKVELDTSGLTPEEAVVRRNTAKEQLRKELKDQFYQLYLMSLPEQSVKKQFMHAEFVTGQSTDWLRVFNVTAQRYANQLPKVKFGSSLRRAVEAAYASTEGMPPRLREQQIDIINELADRATNAASPPDSSKMVSFLSNLTFVQLMTSVGSAFTQTLAMPMAVMPYLSTEYGYGASAKKLGEYLNIINTIGTLEEQPNGEFEFVVPNVGDSSRVRNNPMLRKAYDILANERALFAQTGSLMFLESAPTEGRSKWNYVGKAYDVGMKALALPISALERNTSQMTAMMAFELHYAKTKDFGASIEAAVDTVKQTIGNYSGVNRPTVVDKLVGKNMGRLITQFRMFAVNQMAFIFANARKIITFHPLSVADRAKAMHHVTGRLLMVAIGAGVVGLPLVSTVAMLGDAIDYLTDDDEERKKRYQRDPYTAYDSMANFRKYWIPEHFGSVGFSIGDRKVTLADMLDKGVPTALTGVNFQSRLSMDSMWFRDSMSGDTWKESAINAIAANLSPSVSVQLDMLDGIDKIASGDMQRGFEKMAPAAVRGALQAHRYETEGAKTLSDKTIMSKEEFTEVELAMQRLGFQPARLAEFQRKRIDFENARAKATKERVDLMHKFNMARMDPTSKPEELRGLVEKIYDFNARYPVPTLTITPDRLQNSLDALMRIKGETVRGLRLTPEEARYFYGPEYQDQLMDEGTEEDDFLYEEE